MCRRASCTRAVPIELGTDGRSEVVGRTASAEGHPTVLGPLAVDDHVAVVGERLPPGQPDPVPEDVGQGLGGDHQRVHRDQGALLAPQRAGVALGGPDHHRCAHRAPVRLDCAGPDGLGLGLLVDGHSTPLDRPGQATHQPGRVDGGAVGGEGSAEHAGGPDHGRRLGRRQQPEVVLARHQSSVRRPPPGGSAPSWGPVRARTTVPPWAKPHSMHSAPTTRPTSVDGLHHGPAHERTGPGSGLPVEALVGDGEEG